MKIQLLTKELKPTLQTVINVVEKTKNLPILSHVLIEIKDKILSLTTTDLEIQINSQTETLCDQECYFTIYAKNLIDIIKDLEDKDKINIELIDNKIKIKIKKNKFELNSFNHQEFPKLSPKSEYTIISANAHDLRYLIEKTSQNMCNQDIRSYLNGLYIEASSNELTLVSTDSYRLSIGSIKQTNEKISQESAIIPKKAVNEIIKLLAKTKPNDEVHLQLCPTQIQIKFNNTILLSQLINAKFPNYRQVIPQDKKETLSINRLELLTSLKNITPLVDENNKGIKLKISNDNILITISSERGKAQANVAIKSKIDDLEVNFNVHFLITALSNLITENINFAIPNNSDSYLLENQDDSNYQYIIMPIKI